MGNFYKKTGQVKTLQLLLTISIVIIAVLTLSICIFSYYVDSAQCYIENYDEYIYLNGEIYYKICDENRDLFPSESYDKYQISNLTDLEDRTLEIIAINPNKRFFVDKVRIIYNNPRHDEIVFLSLDHFTESYEYAKVKV